MLHNININQFTSDFLECELYRLFDLFVPHERLPRVSVSVEPSSGDGMAAKAMFNPNSIVLYEDYHAAYPDEYKLTLLHEAGHFVYSRDHSNFDIYYEFLNLRQRFIVEKIIPDSYEEFLYCSSISLGTYTYVCSGCRKRVTSHSSMGTECSLCEKNMLLVGGL